MTAREFRQRVWSLHMLDRDVLLWMTARQYAAFRDSPAQFLLRSDDATAEKLWRSVEARQEVAA